MIGFKAFAPFAFAALLAAAPGVHAQDVKEYALTIKNHVFEPTELRVPAKQRFKLVVTNQDTTPEEFESKSMKLEKVIAPGKSASLFAGPLAAGRYPFEGEFHSKTARGVVIAE